MKPLKSALRIIREYSLDQQEIRVRFWDKIHFPFPSECWEWKAQIQPNGYGRFNIHRIALYAHRVAYELAIGSIPDGLVLDHICRNRKCVRPSHLEPVTPKENLLRGERPFIIPYNSKKTHCKRGHVFNEKNTYYYANGSRICRVCGKLRARKYRKYYK